jgi:hypothetical protein
MLALIGLVVVLFLGLGWYLDWYSFRPATITDPSRKTYTIDINTKKITDDVGNKIHEGEERLHDFFDNETNRAGVPADKKPAPGGTQVTPSRTGVGETETAEPKFPGYPGRQ